MFEWSEELKMVRDAVRTFVDTEIRPHRFRPPWPRTALVSRPASGTRLSA